MYCTLVSESGREGAGGKTFTHINMGSVPGKESFGLVIHSSSHCQQCGGKPVRDCFLFFFHYTCDSLFCVAASDHELPGAKPNLQRSEEAGDSIIYATNQALLFNSNHVVCCDAAHQHTSDLWF